MDQRDRQSLRTPPPPPGHPQNQPQAQPRRKLPLAAVLVCLAAVVIGIWIGAGAEKNESAKPDETVGMQAPPETTAPPTVNQEEPASDSNAVPEQTAGDQEPFPDTQGLPAEGWIEYEGHVYKYYDLGMSWTTAKMLCEDLGGHLVTITSQGEQEAIQELLKNASRYEYWIGAYHPDNAGAFDFVWITDEYFDHERYNWADNSPDRNWSGAEKYLQIFGRDVITDTLNFPKYTWNDLVDDPDTLDDPYFTSDTIGFICEWEP